MALPRLSRAVDAPLAPDDLKMLQVALIYGHSKLEDRHVMEGGRLHFESRRIDTDRSGNRTVGPWERTGVSIGWDDGSPFGPWDLIRTLCA